MAVTNAATGRYNEIGDKGATALAEALAHVPRLARFVLW